MFREQKLRQSLDADVLRRHRVFGEKSGFRWVNDEAQRLVETPLTQQLLGQAGRLVLFGRLAQGRVRRLIIGEGSRCLHS